MADHMGAPTLVERAICQIAERTQPGCTGLLDEILDDYADNGVLDMPEARLVALVAVANVRLRDNLRDAERGGAPTRTLTP